MWDPQHLTTLQASTTCYRNSFILLYFTLLCCSILDVVHILFPNLLLLKCYFHKRPWRAVWLWDVKDPILCRHLAHRWQCGCQSYALTALYSSETLFFCFWYSFLFEVEWTPGRNGVRRIKLIKKIQLPHQCLNHYATVFPHYYYYYYYYYLLPTWWVKISTYFQLEPFL
jgi:hypothetical protein